MTIADNGSTSRRIPAGRALTIQHRAGKVGKIQSVVQLTLPISNCMY